MSDEGELILPETWGPSEEGVKIPDQHVGIDVANKGSPDVVPIGGHEFEPKNRGVGPCVTRNLNEIEDVLVLLEFRRHGKSLHGIGQQDNVVSRSTDSICPESH